MLAVVLNGVGVGWGLDVHLQLSAMGGAHPLPGAQPWMLPGARSRCSGPRTPLHLQPGQRKAGFAGADIIQKGTGHFELNSGISPPPLRVFGASGCCWMLHKTLTYKSVGWIQGPL